MSEDTLLGAAGSTEGTADNQNESLLGGGDNGSDNGENPGESEGQPTDTKAEGQEGGAPEGGEKPQGPPEAYEFTLAEGQELDSSLMEKVTPIFKEMGLTNEQGQKLAEVYAEERQRIDQEYEQAIQDQRKEWREEFKKNPESAKELGFARKAIDHFMKDDQEAMALFTGEASFLSDHPAVARVLAKVGRYISEDQFIDGGKGKPATPKDPAAVLFGGTMKTT